MWRLNSIKTGREYALLCNKEYKIGRSGVNIQITEDTSVSRHHASILVSHTLDNMKDPSIRPVVTLTDKSKFGTFIFCPRTKIKTKVEGSRTLNNGDQIIFGAQQSMFKLKYNPLVISVSMTGNEQKLKLQNAILEIGGHMVSNWHENITHLVMDLIKLSIKVTRALVGGCYIVTPEYVYTLLEFLTDGQVQEINPEIFLPENGEPTLSKQTCSFKVDQNRRKVFSGKVFIFFCEKQLKVLGFSISHGGGKPMSINDRSFDNNLILSSGVVFMLCKDVNIKESDRYKRIERILLNGKKRFIQEHEIGLAVLYCNASVYCNTDFDLNSQNAFEEYTENFSADTSSHVNKLSVDSKSCSDNRVIDTPDATSIATSHNTRKRDRESCTEAEPGLDNSKRFRVDDICIEKRMTTQNWNEGNTSENKISSTKRSSDDSLKGDKSSNNEKSHLFALARPVKEVSNAAEQIISDDVASLDDDNLWSQNFNSSSFVTKNKEKPVIRDTTKTQDLVPSSNQISIKNEPVTPKQTAFPDRNSGKPSMKQVCDNFIPVDKRRSDVLPDIKKELPMPVAEIVVVPLVVRRPNVINQTLSQNAIAVKCHKKFRKVWPTYMSRHGVQTDSESLDAVPPQIIGRNDMYVQGTCARDVQVKQNVITEWLPRNKKTRNKSGFMDLENSNPFSDL